MALPITTKSDTLEGQVFEVAQALQSAELSEPPATRPNRITIALDTETNQISITVTLPVALQRGDLGRMEVVAQQYLDVRV